MLNNSNSPHRHFQLFLVLSLLLFSTSTYALPFRRNNNEKKVIPVNQKKTQYSHWRNSLKNGLASAGAAACCKTLLHPIDCIKTVQQYSPTPISVSAAFRQLYTQRKLFAGLAVTVFGSMPSVAVYFSVYAHVRERLLLQQQWRRVPAIATAAAVGNTVASITRVPYETAKQRLQTGGTLFGGSGWSSFVSVHGIGAQMLRDIPYAILTLVVYETLQQRRRDMTAARQSQQQQQHDTTSKSGSDFVLGGLAGGIGSWLTNPMDVIKTRVQTASSSSSCATIPMCIQAVWRDGGAPAFLRGSIPRLLHKVPANAFFFLFYELFQRVLGVENSTTMGNGEQKKR